MRLFRNLLLGLIFALLATAAFALWHPRSTLPDAWHPFRPLDITHEITPLTQYKLREALLSGEACMATLATGAEFLRMPDFTSSDVCHIRDRIELRSVVGVQVAPVETRCQTALRLAMWTEHGIKPAAEAHFARELTRIRHNSSYSCRAIRTTSGNSNRMSTHATAESIDISGVELSDGRRLSLIEGWSANDERSAFFKEIRDSACSWFRVTLGPEYNRLHADHFHLQHTGWGLCR